MKEARPNKTGRNEECIIIIIQRARERERDETEGGDKEDGLDEAILRRTKPGIATKGAT